MMNATKTTLSVPKMHLFSYTSLPSFSAGRTVLDSFLLLLILATLAFIFVLHTRSHSGDVQPFAPLQMMSLLLSSKPDLLLHVALQRLILCYFTHPHVEIDGEEKTTHSCHPFRYIMRLLYTMIATTSTTTTIISTKTVMMTWAVQ
uniref:Uncharacterized protein n=1 Tax=Lygus hesperus TaxID=30085 RepID=A0A146L9Q8_LYGHE